jgi:hypothetical protein
MLARYRDELARGLAHQQAIALAIATTGISTAGGALSTAFSFLLLVLAEFRGFTQFGVVACIGILVAYLAAIVVLPALVVLFDRVWPWKVRAKPPAGSFTRGDPRPVPRLALAVLAVTLGLAAFGATRLSHIEFEYDLNKLGVPDTETPEQRTRRLQFRSAVGNIQSTDPAIALTTDLAQTRELHRQLQALHEWKPSDVAAITGLPPLSPDPEPTTPPPEKKPPPAKPDPEDEDEDEDEDDITEPDDPAFVALQQVAAAHAVVAPETLAALAAYPPERLREMDDLLASVLSIYSFIPDLQAEKLRVIRDIRERLDKKRGALTGADEEKLKTWDRYLQVDREISVADLPDWVRVQFTDTEGQVGRFVAFWHNGATADYKHAKRIFAAFFTLTASRRRGPRGRQLLRHPRDRRHDPRRRPARHGRRVRRPAPHRLPHVPQRRPHAARVPHRRLALLWLAALFPCSAGSSTCSTSSPSPSWSAWARTTASTSSTATARRAPAASGSCSARPAAPCS